jgi:hypothetical protein
VFQRILRRVARELKQASIPYMVIGGQAVLLYGEPRLTRDIDVTLGIGVDGLARIKKVLPAMGLKVLVKKDQEFVKRTMVLPTKDRESDIRVDFISYARKPQAFKPGDEWHPFGAKRRPFPA